MLGCSGMGSMRRAAGIAAAAMLALMAVLMFASAWNDSLTFDEVPHLAAGYSYLLKADYRFNPEHPPLMKDLGALPLLFMRLRAPWTDKSWTEDSNGEWAFGEKLVFSNDAAAITRAAKAPMILFTIALGGLIFWWTRKRFGDGVSLLALFFYTFSPTFLAHGRLVTNDVGAAAGFFIGTIVFLHFLKNPSWPNVLLAGLALGFAFMTKFSTFALAPIVLVLAVIWALLEEPGTRLRNIRRYLGGAIVVLLVAAFTIYAVYLLHIWNYPPERQSADALQASRAYEMHGITRDLVLWASGIRGLRPWAEYAQGLLMSYRRAEHGGTPFFFGDVSGAAGSEIYFPAVYLLKEPLALHVLTLLALAFIIRRGLVPVWTRARLREHFAEFAFAAVVISYWAVSMRSTLHIGVRHILPTLPFIYVLVAIGIAGAAQLRSFRMVVIVLLAWQAVSVLRVHPSYLAYFNEMGGGPGGGWQYVTDSNFDWGQDLKRLAQFVDQRGISEISLDYFGASDTAYYLKSKVKNLSGCTEPAKGWVAVSATQYTESRRKPECDYRRWLPMEKLDTKVGYSIFVFHVN